MNIRQSEETLEQFGATSPMGRSDDNDMEQTMNITFFRRYFRARNVYWSVMKELGCYTDRELHDLGIDRADVPRIAQEAAAEA